MVVERTRSASITYGWESIVIFPYPGSPDIGVADGYILSHKRGVKIMFALQRHLWSGWGWILASGLVSFVFVLLAFSLWVEGARWVIGVLIGVDLIFSGWWLIALEGMTRTGKAKA